jgi:hypothetical protein
LRHLLFPKERLKSGKLGGIRVKRLRHHQKVSVVPKIDQQVTIPTQPTKFQRLARIVFPMFLVLRWTPTLGLRLK